MQTGMHGVLVGGITGLTLKGIFCGINSIIGHKIL